MKEVLITDRPLLLGELILKLESVADKEKSVYFDDTTLYPTGIGSWRGRYYELAMSYFEYVGYSGYSGDIETVPLNFGKFIKVTRLIEILKEVPGKSFCGYKGGDYVMDEDTPIYVANNGNSDGFKYGEDDKYYQAIVDIEEKKDRVVLVTKLV